MSNNYTRQYEAPVKPQNWTGDALRFYRMLIDVLDDIYLKYGRIDEKMIGSALREKINSKADNGTVAEIVLEQGKLSASFTSLSGEVTQLAVDVDGIVSRVADVESGLESQIKQTPELISAAVGDIQIGGTNLLRGTQYWDTEHWTNIAGKTITDETVLLDGRSLTSGYTETYQHINLEVGRTYTFSVELTEILSTAAGMVLHAFAYDMVTAKVYNAIYALKPALGRHSSTFTVPEGSARFRFCVRAYAGVSFSVKHMQVEEGNKATAWRPSPMDYSKGVVNGSAAIMTPDELVFRGPKISFDVSGTAGDMSLSESGLAIDRINSPSVYARYQGPDVITVGEYSVAPNGDSVFATLGDAFAKLSDKYIPYPVSINFASDTYETSTRLVNACGEAVIINGNNCKHNGVLTIKNVTSEVTFNNLIVQINSDPHAVAIKHCTDVELVQCAVYAGYPTHSGQNGIYAVSSSIGLNGCALSNIYHALWLADNSLGYISSCTGNNNMYSIILRNNSRVGVLVSRPPGTVNADATCNIMNNKDPVDSGTVAQPENVQTVTLTATNTRTHDGSSWYSGTNVLTQGEKSGGVFKGCIWFNRSAFAGKTIKAAAIRLYRKAGVGKGSPVVVKIGSCQNTMPAAGYNVVARTVYPDIIGTVDQKEELKASIPVQAVQELADGTAAGLYIYGSADDYAQFDGFDGEHPPKLLVTYS